MDSSGSEQTEESSPRVPGTIRTIVRLLEAAVVVAVSIDERRRQHEPARVHDALTGPVVDVAPDGDDLPGLDSHRAG